jgi:hypothetical protein
LNSATLFENTSCATATETACSRCDSIEIRLVMGVVAADVRGESVPNFVVLFVDDLGYAEDRAIWKGHT